MITARVQATVHIRTDQTQVKEETTANDEQKVVHQVNQVTVVQARRVIVAHQAAQAVREQVQQL